MAETPAAPAAPKAPAKRSKSKSPAAWAKLVRADLQQAVEGVIKAGQHLIDAKEDVGHGNFEAWVKEEVKISPDTALRLMTIARHPVLSNPATLRDMVLPQEYSTLAQLARIPAPGLTKAIEDGAVFPEMTVKDASKLVRLVENETTGAPISNGGGGGRVSTNSNSLASAPVMDFKSYVEGMIGLNPQKLVETEADQDRMRGELEQLSDWIEQLRELLG